MFIKLLITAQSGPVALFILFILSCSHCSSRRGINDDTCYQRGEGRRLTDCAALGFSVIVLSSVLSSVHFLRISRKGINDDTCYQRGGGRRLTDCAALGFGVIVLSSVLSSVYFLRIPAIYPNTNCVFFPFVSTITKSNTPER